MQATNPRAAEPPSVVSAWLYLVWLSWQRQARVRHMVWISLALLAITAIAVAVQTFTFGWGLEKWQWRSQGRWTGMTYEEAFGPVYRPTAEDDFVLAPWAAA